MRYVQVLINCVRLMDTSVCAELERLLRDHLDSQAQSISARVPHEVCAKIMRHASGYLPSFGIETTYQSPFSNLADSEEDYRRDIISAMRKCSRLRRVSSSWKKELDLMQERHTLLVAGQCDWAKTVETFKRHLGARTHRITIESGNVDLGVAKCMAEIWETLSDIRVISLVGRLANYRYTNKSSLLQGAIARVLCRNAEHLTNIIWRFPDVDIIPTLPMCKAIEKLKVHSSGVYTPEMLSVLDGASINNLHTISISFPLGNATKSNLFTVFASWHFPSLRAVTVDSPAPPKNFRSFLLGSANNIEFLLVTETKCREEDFIPLPVMPSLCQLMIPVLSSKLLLATSQPKVTDLAFTNLGHFLLPHHFLRSNGIRALLQTMPALQSDSHFPELQLVRMRGFRDKLIKSTEWTPYEQSAFHFISRTLKARKISCRWEDIDGNDLHEAIKSLAITTIGNPLYDNGEEFVDDIENDY